MPKPLTLMLAGVIGAVLAVLALAAVTPRLAVPAHTAATTADEAAQPQVYGTR